MKITIDTAKISKEFLKELARLIDSPEVLSELAKDESWLVKTAVAGNPNTSTETLPKLAGTNTVTVKSSWGWTYFDCLKVSALTDASLPSLDAPKELSDPNATDEAKRLMCYLKDMYGEHIISGQQEIYMYGPHDFEFEFEYINDLTGEYPAIRAFDYLNECNILYGSEDGTTDRMIDWAKNKNGIITASWHVTVPKDFANYELGVTKVDWTQATYGVWADDAKTVPATDFDTSQILVEGSKEREYWMACLAELAASIKKLQDENIPIILRPLHEAEGGGGENGSWFFWGQDGSEVYKKLWRLTYNTLVNDYGLHNIIWEWNSYAYDSSENWYPGDNYVDLVAYDKYNCTNWSSGSAVLEHNVSAITSTFYKIVEKYNSKKMVAMSENDSIPTLENLTSEKAGWLYFCPWYDGDSDNIKFLTNPIFNTKEDLTEMYQSDYCITLDELPANLYTDYSLEGFIEKEVQPTEPTDPTDPTETTEPTDPVETEKIEADVTLEKGVYSFDLGTGNEIGDTLYVDFETESNVKSANGCVGISATYDGVNYWVASQWNITKSGVAEVDINNIFEVSYNAGKDKVEDEELIAKILEVAKKQSSGQIQIWWVDDSAGEAIDNTTVTVNDVYVMVDKNENPESTTTITQDPVETTTTKVSEKPVETTVTDEDPTEPSTEETTEATEGPSIEFGEVSELGDVNVDGIVNVNDIITLAKFTLNREVYPLRDSTAYANADIVADKVINSSDISRFVEFLLGSITEL